ncbi:MAG: NAD(P)H-dependent oxidoreductase [Bacteroidota bacterium]
MKKINNNDTVIILGSARSDGNTRTVVNFLLDNVEFDLIDLNDFEIGYFDYDNKNRDDDFLPLMRKITSRYERIIFATPVYWYSMSAIMKTFFDRISDLLIWEKDLGRTLRGKAMGVVSCSGHDDLKNGFDMPFKESADYLGMDYMGHVHAWADNEKLDLAVMDKLIGFLKKMESLEVN